MFLTVRVRRNKAFLVLNLSLAIPLLSLGWEREQRRKGRELFLGCQRRKAKKSVRERERAIVPLNFHLTLALSPFLALSRTSPRRWDIVQ